MTAAEVVEWRLDDAGTAHAAFPGTATARCGTNLRGPRASEGRPCARCLAIATEVLVAADTDAA